MWHLSGVTELRRVKTEKNIIMTKGGSPAEIEDFLYRHTRRADFIKLDELPKPVAFIPVPSTTGRNITPEILSSMLVSAFGGRSFERVADCVHSITSDKCNSSQKLTDRRTFVLRDAPIRYLRDYDPRSIVLVDDYISSGATVYALEKALTAAGLPVAGTVTVSMGDMSRPTANAVEKAAESILINTPSNYTVTADQLRDILQGRSVTYLKNLVKADSSIVLPYLVAESSFIIPPDGVQLTTKKSSDHFKAEGEECEEEQPVTSIEAAKLRKAHLDIEKTEIELQIARGNLLNVDTVAAIAKALATDLRVAVMAIAPRISPLLAPERDPVTIEKMLVAEFLDALDQTHRIEGIMTGVL